LTWGGKENLTPGGGGNEFQKGKKGRVLLLRTYYFGDGLTKKAHKIGGGGGWGGYAGKRRGGAPDINQKEKEIIQSKQEGGARAERGEPRANKARQERAYE